MPSAATSLILSTAVFLLVTLGAFGATAADQAFDPEARAQAIAPYLDRQTIGVLRVEVSHIEPEPLVRQWTRLVPELTVEQDRMIEKMEKIVSVFQEHGFPHLYLVISLADVPELPPFLVLPTTEQSDAEALIHTLKQFAGDRPPLKFEQLPDAVFVGSERAWQRIERQEPDTRPELAEAFGAAGDTALQMLILPTDEHRRVVEQIMPRLPQEIGQGPSTILTRGMLWAAIGIGAPPDVSLRLVMQSQDAAAATALRSTWIEAAQKLAVVVSEVAGLRDLERFLELLTPEAVNDRLVVSIEPETAEAAALLESLALPLEEALSRTWRRESMNRVRQFGLAMHNYHDIHNSLPAQGSVDASGRPLLSWRVHILPHIGQRELFRRFRLDEPWDSPHNRQLIEQMPDIYRSPASRLKDKGLTNYVFPVGEETVCPGRQGIHFREITDGTSNTVLLLEVDDDHAVIWTKPADLPYDLEQPTKGLGGLYKDVFVAVFCDGAGHFLSVDADPDALRAIFTRAGGEIISWDQLR